MIEAIINKARTGLQDPLPYNDVLVDLFRRHVQSKYPGSRHWSPDKIQPSSTGIGVEIDIPGASRAYHDIDIYPKNGEWLAIPLHPFLVGMSARQFGTNGTQPGLFRPFKKGSSGRPELANVLAQKTEGGALVFMYALSKHVHQNRDSSLLPTDDDMFNAIFETYCQTLAQDTGGSLT